MPFAEYTDFEDCVQKNRGKVQDPEAYCGTIKRKVEKSDNAMDEFMNYSNEKKKK